MVDKVKVDKAKKVDNSKGIIFFIIGAIILVIIVVLFLVNQSNITGNVVVNSGSNCRNVEVSYEEQEEYMKTEYYTETVPYTDRECEKQYLSYNIKDFGIAQQTCNNQEERCIDYVLGICVKKEVYCVSRTIACSLTLNNLDNTQGGTFVIRFNYYPLGIDDVTERQASFYLYPQSSQMFSTSTLITSSGVNGVANKQFSCSYLVSGIPTKEVCRDVTKYQEVQRERQVTAYRPITKYRTEQQCS